MRKLFAVLALLTCASATFAQHMATTTIADALYNPDGSPASGEIIIRANQTFRTADGYTVVAGTKYFANLGTGGTFSIAIAPTTMATPAGSSYTAVYVTALSETTQLWIVPPSSSPLNLSQVQIAPAATLFPFSSIVPPLNCVSLGGVIQYTTSGYTCISTAITSISESQVTGLAASLAGLVSTATTVNGHPLTGNVTISASDLTTGTLGAWLFPGLWRCDEPGRLDRDDRLGDPRRSRPRARDRLPVLQRLCIRLADSLRWRQYLELRHSDRRPAGGLGQLDGDPGRLGAPDRGRPCVYR